MMNLKLLNRVNSSDTATLILRNSSDGILEYYIIARNVNCDIVCNGKCNGTMERDMVSFDIRMGSLLPLIDKGYKFTISYSGGKLSFHTEDENITITPLYVEFKDAYATSTIDKYVEFNAALEDVDRRQAKINDEKDVLQRLKWKKASEETVSTSQSEEMKLLNLSGFLNESANPWSEPKTKTEEPSVTAEMIAEQENKIAELEKQAGDLLQLDLGKFTQIAICAASCGEIIDMCDSYAISAMATSFVVQKEHCPVMSIQGKLLLTLIRDADGKGFFWYKNSLVYMSGEEDRTVIFITKCLPNNAIDSSIITRGAVTEKYTIHFKDMLKIASIVKSTFHEFTLNMGDGCFTLSNELNESIKAKFAVEDARTLQLNKLMRGETVVGSVTMADIKIPKEVQSILNLFRDDLTIYVKEKKVIFNSGTLYVVFGR